MWDLLITWFLSVSAEYGVNPLVFGGLYLGTTPLYVGAVAWLVRNLRRSKPVTVPGLLAIVFFAAAYLYLFVAGQNLPISVYVGAGCMAVAGAYCAYRKCWGTRAEPGRLARRARKLFSSDTDWL